MARLSDTRNPANDDDRIGRLVDDYGPERVADAVLSAVRSVAGNAAVDALLDTLVTDHMSDDAVEAWTETGPAGVVRAAAADRWVARL